MQADTVSNTSQNFGWMSQGIVDERAAKAAPYNVQGGLEAMHETGTINITPHGARVLLRAILTTDGSALTAGVDVDARKCICHEVVAIGDGCAKWWSDNGVMHGPAIGDHVFVVTPASDRMSKYDHTVRLMVCHVEDISAFWIPPKS